MDGYCDDTCYIITFLAGGYLHEVKVDAWITADVTALALSAKVGRVMLVNNFNGAEACFRDGVKIWSDNGVTDATA